MIMTMQELERDLNNIPQYLDVEQGNTYAVLFAELVKRYAKSGFRSSPFQAAEEPWKESGGNLASPSGRIGKLSGYLEFVLFAMLGEEAPVAVIDNYFAEILKPFSEKRNWLDDQVLNSSLYPATRMLVTQAISDMAEVYAVDSKIEYVRKKEINIMRAQNEFELTFGEFAGNIEKMESWLLTLVGLMNDNKLTKEDVDVRNVLTPEQFEAMVKLPITPEACAWSIASALKKSVESEQGARLLVNGYELDETILKIQGFGNSKDVANLQYELYYGAMYAMKSLGLKYADIVATGIEVMDEQTMRKAIVDFARHLSTADSENGKILCAELRDVLPEDWYVEKSALTRYVSSNGWARGKAEGEKQAA